ncbi:MAG: VTT domain-containing protein [Thermomicrobiales bacterium]|nr:VTT domain-containing protein [Thermomicrobiales bacterium]
MPMKLVLLLTGAYLIVSPPMLLAAIALLAMAELAGTLVLHGIARSGSVRLLERMASDRQARVQATFDRWRARLGGRDVATIAILRLIPFVRFGVAIGSGLAGIRARDFVAGSAIAAVIWTSVPLSLGYAFRASLEPVERIYGSLLGATPLAIGLAMLTAGPLLAMKSGTARHWAREALATRRRPARPASALPEIGQEASPGLG